MLIQTIESGVGGDAVQLPNLSFIQVRGIKPCYAGVKFGSDGIIYSIQENGGDSAVGNWLLSGTASDFYISRTLDSGTFNDADAGAGPLQLNTDRAYRVVQATFGGSTSCIATFQISDDVSGTPVLADNQYQSEAILF